MKIFGGGNLWSECQRLVLRGELEHSYGKSPMAADDRAICPRWLSNRVIALFAFQGSRLK